jgi:hypothetical protein
MTWNPKFGLAVCLCALTWACKRPDPIRLQPTIEEAPALAATVRMSDASAADQLLSGFYPTESNAWRWTAQKFAVSLGTPPGAVRNGAWLVLACTIPEASLQIVKKLTLSAKIGATQLAPEEFSTPGDHQYRREVPASVLNSDTVTAEFTLDKSFRPVNDNRELGLVVTAVGLEPK